MKTHRIYYDDAYEREFNARVVHCELLPPDVNSGITAQVLGLVLDRTAFYPASGGQPHDLGKIGDANVLDVRDDGDEIIHVVDHRPASPDVLGCINWPRRFDHMQQHSGQHLLSAMFQERYGRTTVSFISAQTFAPSTFAVPSLWTRYWRAQNARRTKLSLKIGP